MSILVSPCFGFCEFTRFQIAKTKRVRRFYMSKNLNFLCIVEVAVACFVIRKRGYMCLAN